MRKTDGLSLPVGDSKQWRFGKTRVSRNANYKWEVTNMNRKALSVMLTAAMAAGLLAGCGSSSTGTGTASSTAASSTAAETTAAESTAAESTAAASPLTITLWDIATEDPTKSIQEGAVQRFMADYPNITVNQVHQQNDNYKQQLVVAMSSGQCPDMYIHWGGGPMAEYYKSGFANDLTELYNTYDHPAFIDAAIAQASYDGKLLAIPFGGMSGCDVFYNKTIFKEVGIEKTPETIDELEEDCKILKDKGYTPFALANASKWTGSMYYMYLVARHSGNDEFNAAYTQENGGSFASEAFIYAGTKIQDWVKAGYFPDGVNSLTADDGQDKQLLYDGTCAISASSASRRIRKQRQRASIRTSRSARRSATVSPSTAGTRMARSTRPSWMHAMSLQPSTTMMKPTISSRWTATRFRRSKVITRRLRTRS